MVEGIADTVVHSGGSRDERESASDSRPGIDRLLAIVAALRAPATGCDWDRSQTHDSLAPYAIEEAYELVDAVTRGDLDDMRDELGDCLLQVVFHARVAEEAGTFVFADIVDSIVAKMLRRHPLVFGGAAAQGGAKPPAWDAIKAGERTSRAAARPGDVVPSLLEGVPLALPGLTRAIKLQARAAAVGFDWNDVRLVLAKVREEVDEVEAEIESRDPAALRDEIGDLLFAVGNLARHLNVDPEAALRSANGKFSRRFNHIEGALAARGTQVRDVALPELEALWGEAKRAERMSPQPLSSDDDAA